MAINQAFTFLSGALKVKVLPKHFPYKLQIKQKKKTNKKRVSWHAFFFVITKENFTS